MKQHILLWVLGIFYRTKRSGYFRSLSFALHFVWKSEPTIARLVLFILYEGAASAIAYFVLLFILNKLVPCAVASHVLFNLWRQTTPTKSCVLYFVRTVPLVLCREEAPPNVASPVVVVLYLQRSGPSCFYSWALYFLLLIDSVAVKKELKMQGIHLFACMLNFSVKL